MVQTTAQQRVSWQEFECNEHKLVDMAFGPGRILVAPPTCDAWRALATVLRLNNYKIRPADTSSYNCREITAGSGKSLHSYGLAVDIKPSTNPFVLTLDGRAARFSNKATQDERAQEVRLGQADTDMTPQMIADVRAIKTKNGNVVFDWGGNWNDRKDPMHFEVDVSPADLQTGIDWNTVKGADGQPAADVAWGHEGEEAPIHVETFAGELGVFEKCYPAVEKWEGQFLNDPNDPRGPTNMGITQDELARFRERPVTQDELRDLTREEARQILRELYWKPIRADRLPLPVVQVCYDAAVLTGVRRAGRTLQEALNRQGNDLAVDGIIGRATIGAAREADPNAWSTISRPSRKAISAAARALPNTARAGSAGSPTCTASPPPWRLPRRGPLRLLLRFRRRCPSAFLRPYPSRCQLAQQRRRSCPTRTCAGPRRRSLRRPLRPPQRGSRHRSLHRKRRRMA
jgi:Glycosyl hydrolase 108/D-alanyl-D-alanine carboxypeptidase